VARADEIRRKQIARAHEQPARTDFRLEDQTQFVDAIEVVDHLHDRADFLRQAVENHWAAVC
jgi:hypothetical protein